MSAAELPAPVRVSPFIRACRYGFLFTGIMYGALKFRFWKRKETKRRDFENKQKAILDAKKAEESKIAQRNELLTLAKECSITPPAGF
ncbi:hypothetical protein JTE90_009383 [Oedothorax gibbosus]|uniref:ATP synthase F(0) complex subunit e, mitochondrial n=1 Tax=Oedothorax gibbosus TaxID=931172 RepID=A0AAV6VRQ3_9ARAC|nr:hypothetical protein JTE90_009383 [Oedothorax gibbosus]